MPRISKWSLVRRPSCSSWISRRRDSAVARRVASDGAGSVFGAGAGAGAGAGLGVAAGAAAAGAAAGGGDGGGAAGADGGALGGAAPVPGLDSAVRAPVRG